MAINEFTIMFNIIQISSKSKDKYYIIKIYHLVDLKQ